TTLFRSGLGLLRFDLAAGDLGRNARHFLGSGVHLLKDHGDRFARLLDLAPDLLARRDVLHEIEAPGQILDRAVLASDPLVGVLDGTDEAALLGVRETQPPDVLRDADGPAVQLAGGRPEQARAGLQAPHPLQVLIARARQPPDAGDGALDDAEFLLYRLLGLLLGHREHLFESPALLLDALGGREDLRDHPAVARERLEDALLAALDAARDRHLALAGEQRHGAHLPQVHADRGVRLLERSGRQVELRALFFGRERLLRLVGGDALLPLLLGVHELDPVLAETVVQLLDLLHGRG